MSYQRGSMEVPQSALEKLMARRENGGDHVVHVCPECGGDFAEHIGALVVVAVCWACKGAGVLTDDQLSWYEQQCRDGNRGLNIT